MSQLLENNDNTLLRLHSVCIGVMMIWQISRGNITIQSLLTRLDLPYHCDVNTHIVQPQQGVLIFFKLLGHTVA